MNALTTWTDKQLALIRRTVAKDTNADEFDQFMHICKHTRLDPLRRQVYCFVFNKHKPEWRQMTVVTAIGGYRSIAERTGNYRPDEDDARIEYSDAAKDPKTNPLGIVKATIVVFKYSHGEWHRVAGSAHWDEYVPLKDGVIDTKKTGWTKMPRIMIAKCAEANALRKAWPDDFAGLEVEEEVDRRATIDLTASELADAGETSERMARIGGPNQIIVDWCDGDALQMEPAGQFGDKVLQFIRAHKSDDADRVRMFASRNAAALKQYWALDKNGALAVKQEIERLEAAS